jgi:hypothetical protein
MLNYSRTSIRQTIRISRYTFSEKYHILICALKGNISYTAGNKTSNGAKTESILAIKDITPCEQSGKAVPHAERKSAKGFAGNVGPTQEEGAIRDRKTTDKTRKE